MKDNSSIIHTLCERFKKHQARHKGISWDTVLDLLQKHPKALAALSYMEDTGGEPDVVWTDKGTVVFCDCSKESPTGRRSFCYDDAARRSRKAFKPKNSATGVADEMGISLLTEDEYRKLQTLGEFDTKTSSWIHTPKEVRSLGGALFADRRFNRVFTYHNGAESYYASRGFRALVRVG